jgi:putative endonuclease
MHTVYLLRCKNNSLYCGYTTDLSRRVYEHLYAKIGAKYTKRFVPIAIAAAWEVDADLSLALKAECAIKKLTKQKKEELVLEPKSDFMIGGLSSNKILRPFALVQLQAIWGAIIHKKEVK